MYFEVLLLSLGGEGDHGVIAEVVLVDGLLAGFEFSVVEEN